MKPPFFKSFNKQAIVGDIHQFSLEQRIFHAVLLLCGWGNLQGAIILPDTDISPIFKLALWISTLLCIGAYLLSRKYHKFLYGLFLFTIVQISMLSLAWLENGGLRGIVPVAFVMMTVTNIQFYPTKYVKHLIVGTFFLFFIYVFLELKYPHLQVQKEIPIELLIMNFGMMLIFSFSILLLFKFQYKKWENSYRQKEKQLALALEKEKEINGLKNQFIAMVSHQFRTPMTVITSSTELIELHTAHKLKETEHQKIQKQVQQIYSSVKTVTTMMERILTYGRVESDRVIFMPIHLDIIEFLEHLIARYPTEASIPKKKLKVLGQPKYADIDQNLIDHSVTNLIVNAIKYDPEHRFPQIAINFQASELIISVKDQGIGIPKEEQHKLFSPFFRAKNVANLKGTGIGLAVVKHFIEIHKGHVRVESELNQGCCFYIHLPYRVAEPTEKM